VVWAEVTAACPAPGAAEEALGRLGVRYSPIVLAAATAAGVAWRLYRQTGGGRQRLVPDFLVAAHAQVQTERLLTRDRGFYGAQFRGLVVVDPTSR
jgi:predicted nucleic acid-binding protein